MNKKELRKELERALSKSITDTLNKRNALAAGEIKKKIEDASESLAKKFYKTIKELNKKPIDLAKTIEKVSLKNKKSPVKKAKAASVKKAKK
jgi:hypothetical protein